MFLQSLLATVPLVALSIPSFAQPVDPDPKPNSIFPLFNLPSGFVKEANLSDPASLSAIGVECTKAGGDPAHSQSVVFEDCLHAIGKTNKLISDFDLLMPKVWGTANFPEHKSVTIPRGWQRGSCAMVVGTSRPMDAGEFSLVMVTFFASLVLNKCVAGEKTPFGGRYEITDGGIYVDVTGNKPGRGILDEESGADS